MPLRQWTEEELDALAQVSDADMQAALAAWDASAPEGYESLPLAVTEEDEEDSLVEEIVIGGLLLAASTSFAWDASLGVYVVIATRETVTFQTVREIAENVAQAQLIGMEALTRQLQEGLINVAEWQLGMARHIKTLHVNAMVLARGGWAQMSQADWGFVGSRVKEQYRFLRNFANQISNGTQALDGRALVRAGMYEDAARASYEEMRRRSERLYNNMEEERRELGAADHCDDCLTFAGMGWQPINTLPRIGESQCRTNCHCRFAFRRRGEDGWVMSGE
jgi:hypothetical protein